MPMNAVNNERINVPQQRRLSCPALVFAVYGVALLTLGGLHKMGIISRQMHFLSKRITSNELLAGGFVCVWTSTNLFAIRYFNLDDDTAESLFLFPLLLSSILGA